MLFRIIRYIFYYSIILLIFINIFTAFSLFCFQLYINHVTKNINLNQGGYLPENIFTEEIIEEILNKNRRTTVFFLFIV